MAGGLFKFTGVVVRLALPITTMVGNNMLVPVVSDQFKYLQLFKVVQGGTLYRVRLECVCKIAV